MHRWWLSWLPYARPFVVPKVGTEIQIVIIFCLICRSVIKGRGSKYMYFINRIKRIAVYSPVAAIQN